MSENSQENASRRSLSRSVIAEMLQKNLEKLPDIDRKMLAYGPLYLGGNAALAGLISNSLYRRALNVKQAWFASSLPMAVLPFLGTVAVYTAVVTKPLLAGDLDCPTCAVIRGALVGAVGGGLYPILLALPLNVGLASRYYTTPLPEKGNMLRFCVDVVRPVLRRMKPVVLLQAGFGAYLGTRNSESYHRLAHITFGPGEELAE
ncbi:transmembrane protein 126A [Pholidichthys leucotaenia]